MPHLTPHSGLALFQSSAFSCGRPAQSLVAPILAPQSSAFMLGPLYQSVRVPSDDPRRVPARPVGPLSRRTSRVESTVRGYYIHPWVMVRVSSARDSTRTKSLYFSSVFSSTRARAPIRPHAGPHGLYGIQASADAERYLYTTDNLYCTHERTRPQLTSAFSTYPSHSASSSAATAPAPAPAHSPTASATSRAHRRRERP